jgi:cholesterol transport system auxiliary component
MNRAVIHDAVMRGLVRSLLRSLTLALPLLGGCFSGFNSNQAPQQTYVLGLQAAGAAPAAGSAAASTGAPEVAPSNSVAAAADSLQVLLPVAVAGLGGDGIAVMRPGQRLDYYSEGHWAAPAPAMLQTLVIQTLRRQGRFALVESDSGPFEATYLLSLELTHFEADYAPGASSAPPTVRVELVCALGGRIGRRVLESFTATSAVAADADRMQAVVAAFEHATNDMLAQLASRIVPPSAGSAGAASSTSSSAPSGSAEP